MTGWNFSRTKFYLIFLEDSCFSQKTFSKFLIALKNLKFKILMLKELNEARVVMTPGTFSGTYSHPVYDWIFYQAAKTQNIEDHKKRVAQQQEILENRMERQNKRKMMRFLTTQRLYKSMQMLQANAKEGDEDSTPFEDYSIFLYRQTAPDFKDRVKEMENRILYGVSNEQCESRVP